MREIKFRFWEKSDTKVNFEGKMHYNSDEYFNKWCGNPEYETMQFTGLKDKNGKEIYEGDIVKENQPDRDGNPWIHQIEQYPDRLFHFVGEGMFVPESCEIIGNIYENPELLIN